MAGYDTANYVNNVYSAAVSKYGTPAFWLRYFSPCQTTPLNKSSSNEISECRAIYDSGGPHLGPITVPTQSRLGNTTNGAAYGHADAQTLASALYATWANVAPLLLPSNGMLYCWLDQEPNYDLCLQYWNAWADYINTYAWPDGSRPLYACLYTNPCSAQKNCSTLGNANAKVCFAIWSYEPYKCGYSVKNPPSFAAYTCNGCGVSNGVPTQLWQFAQQGVCSLSVNVDMDLGGGGISYANYCFNVSYRP